MLLLSSEFHCLFYWFHSILNLMQLMAHLVSTCLATNVVHCDVDDQH